MEFVDLNEIDNREPFLVLYSNEEGAAENVYRELLMEFKDNKSACPTVIVCSAIAVEGRYLDAAITNEGILLICEGISYRSVKNQLQVISASLADVFPARYAYWEYAEALDICGDLRIRCPQIIHTTDPAIVKNMGGCTIQLFGDTYPIVFINANASNGCIAQTIPHELRHIWQHKYKEKKYFSNYVFCNDPKGDEDIRSYYLMPAEVDAEAFSFRRSIYHKTATFPVMWYKDYPDVNAVIEERARKMILPTKYSY